jgi:cyclopropane fatty-acyl-phospholipid synthase-like methyltransferase
MEVIDQIAPGRILLPAEGEGRNAVYAAKKGWEVDAFDFSKVAQINGLKLAEWNDVRVNYFLGDFRQLKLPQKKYDAIALIYAHFDPEYWDFVFELLLSKLKIGGILVMEVFSKDQVKYNSGGPRELEVLYSLEDLKRLTNGLIYQRLEKAEVILKEGIFHKGKASVIRMFAMKTQ